MILGIFEWRWHGESRDLRKWENQRQHIRRWQIDDEGLLQVKHGEEVGAGNQMDRFSGDLCGDFGINSLQSGHSSLKIFDVDGLAWLRLVGI